MCVLAGLGRVPRRTWALLMLLSLGFTLPVRADNLTLAWDPSSDPSATAYKLYYSTTSGTYSNSVSAGANTTATVSGLLPGNTYFFSATALNDAGLESPFSNEVSYTVPGNINQPPTLDAISAVSINQDTAQQTVNLTGITSGAPSENQTLIVSASSSNPLLIPNPSVTYTSPNTTGSISFTPAAGASGSSTISVTVDDGQVQNNTITRTFTVTVVGNQAPTLTALGNVTMNENGPAQNINLTGISSGSVSENQTLSVTASAANPSLISSVTTIYSSPNTTGTLSFSPAVNAYGTTTITVTVNDGQPQNNTFSRSFSVTVRPVNQPPTLSPLSNVTISEDAGQQIVNLSGISSGAANEQQTLTVTTTSSNPNLIPNPSVSYVSPAATGTLRFTPAANAFGVATLTVRVNDGQPSNNIVTRTFDVTVSSVNDAPTLDLIPNVTVNENSPWNVQLTGITAGPANEVQPLTVTAASSDLTLAADPVVSYVSPATTGMLSLAPVTNATGTATITVTVSDGSLSAVRSFTLTVQPVSSRPDNTPPTISAITNQTIAQDTSTTAIPFSIGDAETAAINLSLSGTSDNQLLAPDANILLQGVDGNRTVTVTPAAGQTGLANITLNVSDGIASNSVTFALTVLPVGPSVAVSWTGNGRVTPNLSNQTLVPGNTYALTAVPNPGQIFCGWTGSQTSSAPRISFVLNAPLSFQAHFDPITIITNGVGTLSTNLAASTSLVEGRSYSVTALPAAGQVFAGWTGTYTSSAPKLIFVMGDDTVLIANFIPSPYPSVAGTYNGMFYSSDGVQTYSAGFVNLAVTAKGSYSGSFRLGGNRVSFSGRLNVQCTASNTIAVNSGTNVVLMFGVGTGAQANQLFGVVGGGAWGASLVGDRAVFNATTNPCPYVGSYTLAFPRQDDDPTLPMGHGFGTVKISASGTALFAGTLADGTKISQSMPISSAGAWPLYASLYSGQGVFMSWMNFENRVTDDIHGVVDWIKSPIATATYYPGGFAVESTGLGSLYAAPPNSIAHILNLTTATIDFSGGNLAAEFTNSISLGNSSAVSNLSVNSLSLSFNLNTGVFSGQVQDPSSGSTFSISGAVFQKLNNGTGLLLGATQSSRVLLGP